MNIRALDILPEKSIKIEVEVEELNFSISGRTYICHETKVYIRGIIVNAKNALQTNEKIFTPIILRLIDESLIDCEYPPSLLLFTSGCKQPTPAPRIHSPDILPAMPSSGPFLLI